MQSPHFSRYRNELRLQKRQSHSRVEAAFANRSRILQRSKNRNRIFEFLDDTVLFLF